MFESVARKYAVLRPHLDERQRRLVLGVEADDLGRGGIPSRRSLGRPGCIRTRLRGVYARLSETLNLLAVRGPPAVDARRLPRPTRTS